MTIIQEIFGVICALIAVGTYQWITSINARVVSYAERIWPWVSLIFITLGMISGIMAAKSIQFGIDTDTPLFITSGLVCLILAYICYLSWMSALDEESY